MTDQQLIIPFDYATLAPDVSADIRHRTGEIKRLAQRTVEDVVAIGVHLHAVKEKLPGKFGDWLQAEFQWSDRTAQRFMSVAEAFPEPDTVSGINIDLSALYLLAAPSTPLDVRDEVLDDARDGQPITRAAVQEATRTRIQQVADQIMDLYYERKTAHLNIAVIKRYVKPGLLYTALNLLGTDKKLRSTGAGDYVRILTDDAPDLDHWCGDPAQYRAAILATFAEFGPRKRHEIATYINATYTSTPDAGAFTSVWDALLQSGAIIQRDDGTFSLPIADEPEPSPLPASGEGPGVGFEPDPAADLRVKINQDLISIAEGRTDAGATHRCIEIARRLGGLGFWNGEDRLTICFPYELHDALFGVNRADRATVRALGRAHSGPRYEILTDERMKIRMSLLNDVLRNHKDRGPLLVPDLRNLCRGIAELNEYDYFKVTLDQMVADGKVYAVEGPYGPCVAHHSYTPPEAPSDEAHPDADNTEPTTIDMEVESTILRALWMERDYTLAGSSLHIVVSRQHDGISDDILGAVLTNLITRGLVEFADGLYTLSSREVMRRSLNTSIDDFKNTASHFSPDDLRLALEIEREKPQSRASLVKWLEAQSRSSAPANPPIVTGNFHIDQQMSIHTAPLDTADSAPDDTGPTVAPAALDDAMRRITEHLAGRHGQYFNGLASLGIEERILNKALSTMLQQKRLEKSHDKFYRLRGPHTGAMRLAEMLREHAVNLPAVLRNVDLDALDHREIAEMRDEVARITKAVQDLSTALAAIEADLERHLDDQALQPAA